ncbi:MAG: cupredoxin domain-containing protein [Thaumarchaeota archaeon]|nr:cupredoxin domain-containing protein [Nitrososphaerota archaeon]
MERSDRSKAIIAATIIVAGLLVIGVINFRVPTLPMASATSVVNITLVAKEVQLEVADGVTFNAWTFNGTIPGPTVWVNQGDTIHFKLINDGSMGHSMDFHAAEIDWSVAYATIAPGETKTFDFTPRYPGVFMYHCGTPPVIQHISNGMYGAIIVKPVTPLPPAPGGEFVLVESEFYTKHNADGTSTGDIDKMLAANPDYVVFNGKAFQYQKSPLLVQQNERVRLYLLNAGTNLNEAFHVIGAILDTVYIDGNPANVQRGLQTVDLPPSGGAIVDLYFPDIGKNPFVTHAFAYASKGAVGVFQVVAGATVSSSTSFSTTSVATSTSPTTTSSVSIVSGAAVDTSNPGYLPAKITVIIGVNNTIRWTNDDNAPHTVTAADKSFDSGNMNQGDTFTYTFTTAGTYNYVCLYHPWMKAVVVVLKAP